MATRVRTSSKKPRSRSEESPRDSEVHQVVFEVGRVTLLLMRAFCRGDAGKFRLLRLMVTHSLSDAAAAAECGVHRHTAARLRKAWIQHLTGNNGCGSQPTPREEDEANEEDMNAEDAESECGATDSV